MKAADLNGDGSPDLVVALGGHETSNHRIAVLLGNGNGTFRAAVSFEAGSNPSSLALGDLNEDGKTDVIVNNGTGRMQGVSVLLGDGDGTVKLPVRYDTDEGPLSVVLSDF